MDNVPTFQMLLERMPARIAHFRIAQNMRQARERAVALIAEDQLFSRTILNEMLRHHFEVLQSASAKEALHQYLENAPDIVFLDIELMDENGHSLAKVMRAVDPHVFIVMVTANHSAEDIALAKVNRVDGFIAKPYSKQKIEEVLTTFLSKRLASPTEGITP